MMPPCSQLMDIAAADDVASHVFLQPAMILAAAYGVTFHLRGALYMFVGEVMVVVRIQIFSKGNAGAFAVGDLAVLNDPALAPMGADHSVLIGGRRRPGGSGLCRYENR